MVAAGGVAGQTSVAAKSQLAKTTRSGSMKITRNASQPFKKGPAEYFTGSVRIDQPFQGSAPARVGGAFVTFEPRARTAWHTHPLGQTLIVISGLGWVQVEGSAKGGNTARRCGLDSGRREALAWRDRYQPNDSYCYRGGS